MSVTPPTSAFVNSRSATASPMIAPMHDPARSAIVQSTKPLGSLHPNQAAVSSDPSLGQKALFAKKFAQQNKPTFSPTDAIQSPCTAKLNSAKQRRFAKSKAPSGASARLTALAVTDENATAET